MVSIVDGQFPVLMHATMSPTPVPIAILVLHKIGYLVKQNWCTEMNNLMESK